MKQIIEDLYKFDRYLLGVGYDNALDYIKMLIPLNVIEVKSGTKVGDWVIPKEWVIRDGWIKFNGEKIVDYKKDPLAVTVCSLPVNKTVDREELKKHLHASVERPDSYAYSYKFYDRDWGFSMPKNKVLLTPAVDPMAINPEVPQSTDVLPEGQYEVFVDSEDRDGIMKIGVHTIPGKSDREILIFAHLDHPHQANDNLSGVACLIDMAGMMKDRFDHTIKLIFCPETIGSIAYAETQDISKVDFVLSVDSIGNDETLLFQKSFDKFDRLNYCMHLAVAGQGVSYRKGEFRHEYGADEYYFNDPKVGIPGIFLTRLPYKEYHTADDTPDKIIDEKIKEVQRVILKCIDFYERDYIPEMLVKGPIMRSKYGIQATDKMLNKELDYLFYSIDGKKYLTDIIMSLGVGFDFAYDILNKLGKENVRRVNPSKVKKQSTSTKKHKRL
jgi:aminopeptidase-like protein